MAGECLATGPVVAALTTCRNWITYAPSQPYNPNQNIQPTGEQIRADLQQLFSEGFRGLVTYTLDGPFAQVPRIAKELGFTQVIAGLFWYDAGQLERELTAVGGVNEYADAYVLGNEGLGYGGQNVRYSVSELLAQMNVLRARTGKPVTTTETFPNYQANPSLATAGDWVFPNLQPWFNATLNPSNIGGMVQAVVGEVNALRQLAGSRVVVVKESWWPTAGPDGASESNQVKYFRQLAEQSVFFVWGEAYDQPWKSEQSPFGTVGPHWGLHDPNRTAKAVIADLKEIYTGPYFAPRDLLPGALAFLQQMTLANGLPQNEATASELATLSDTVNSIATHNRFFNPAQAGFWLTTSVLAHALRQRDATFTAGLTDAALISELTGTIGSLETIANTDGAVYRSGAGQTPTGLAFFHNYDSATGLPRAGAADREVPFLDNGYLAVGLLSVAEYLRRAAGPTTDTAFSGLATRADALARRINFALWFDVGSQAFHLGGPNDPQAGGFVDRLTSEGRLVPVLALALGQISRTEFDAIMLKLVRESRSGSRTTGAPAVERLPVFGTALELFVPTIFLSTERATLFGQSTLAAAVFATIDTARSLGLPAAGAMGVANGGTPGGGDARYLNFGLSPAELPGDANNPRDPQVLIPAAAAIMAGAMGQWPNPQLQAAGEAAARNLVATTQQLRAVGQLDPKYGTPNYLDFGSHLVNTVNPVRGFLEMAQLAVALLNDELGGDYLEQLLRRDSGWRSALSAYRQALNVRELEFAARGSGRALIRSQASGGSNLAAPAATDGGVWHLAAPGDAVTYELSVGTAGVYRIKVRYSNHDGGTLDNVQIALNGQPVSGFITTNTNDWNRFTETGSLPLGELLPGSFQVTFTLASTDGFGVDLDALSLTSSPRRWHNAPAPRDVNDDTLVTAVDVLIVINELNTNGNRQLPLPPPSDAAIDFYDVNDDGAVTPVDALTIIDFLNHANGISGEGESPGAELASVFAATPLPAPGVWRSPSASPWELPVALPVPAVPAPASWPPLGAGGVDEMSATKPSLSSTLSRECADLIFSDLAELDTTAPGIPQPGD